MNDHYRELLRQYFFYKDQFLVAKYTPIEQKLREAVGYERSGQSPKPLHERADRVH